MSTLERLHVTDAPSLNAAAESRWQDRPMSDWRTALQSAPLINLMTGAIILIRLCSLTTAGKRSEAPKLAGTQTNKRWGPVARGDKLLQCAERDATSQSGAGGWGWGCLLRHLSQAAWTIRPQGAEIVQGPLKRAGVMSHGVHPKLWGGGGSRRDNIYLKKENPRYLNKLNKLIKQIYI